MANVEMGERGVTATLAGPTYCRIAICPTRETCRAATTPCVNRQPAWGDGRQALQPKKGLPDKQHSFEPKIIRIRKFTRGSVVPLLQHSSKTITQDLSARLSWVLCSRIARTCVSSRKPSEHTPVAGAFPA